MGRVSMMSQLASAPKVVQPKWHMGKVALASMWMTSSISISGMHFGCRKGVSMSEHEPR